MMKAIKTLVLSAGIFLSGCDQPMLASDNPGYGAVRERLFVQCMKLAANTVRAGHYNDSAEVIERCQQTSMYMANSYRADGYKTLKQEKKTNE